MLLSELFFFRKRWADGILGEANAPSGISDQLCFIPLDSDAVSYPDTDAHGSTPFRNSVHDSEASPTQADIHEPDPTDSINTTGSCG